MFPPASAPNASFPFRIERQVGVGAMGVVYQAIDTSLERQVAIKALRPSVVEKEAPEVQQEVRNRFLQEARAAAALSHPGVATVYHVDQVGDIPYMVMEWLEGKNLEQILAERKKLGLRQAVKLTIDLLDALSAAHAKGVVHRDIKPSNLMIMNDGRLKVTDFGIARLQGRELVKTQAGIVLATPKFASPEQLHGADVDGRADIFSTGILLYHMLTGALPFEGKTFMELATAILHSEPTPVRHLDARIPAGIEAVIRIALRKKREDRFQTAADMADQLKPFLSAPRVQPAAQTDTGALTRPPTRPAPVSEQQAMVPEHRNLPQAPALAIVKTVTAWPEHTMSQQPTHKFIEKLLEKPLHAAPFAGAAVLDHACLLIQDGMLLGAIDTFSGESGDVVTEDLPAQAAPKLYAVPQGLSPRIVPLLATLLHPPNYRHKDLDSSFINLPAMLQRMNEEKLDGIFHLGRGPASGWVFLDRGEPILTLYSEGWEDLPVDQSWRRWISEAQVRASVIEKNAPPLSLWYQKVMRNLTFIVEPMPEDKETSNKTTRSRRLFSSPKTNNAHTSSLSLRLADGNGLSPEGKAVAGYENDPVFRFLSWGLAALPHYLTERDKTARWKYLSEWLLLTRRAFIHYDLPRAGTRSSDFFDFVTTDKSGKVLHLGQRFARATPKIFQTFLDHVIEVKRTRLKTGDIGGVFLIAPDFDERVLEAYSEAVQSSARKWLGMEESFTGYEGFVRVGARRGFHLMLVEESPSGEFKPFLM